MALERKAITESVTEVTTERTSRRATCGTRTRISFYFLRNAVYQIAPRESRVPNHRKWVYLPYPDVDRTAERQRQAPRRRSPPGYFVAERDRGLIRRPALRNGRADGTEEPPAVSAAYMRPWCSTVSGPELLGYRKRHPCQHCLPVSLAMDAESVLPQPCPHGPMASNQVTIAGPNDGNMLSVVGFDTATPEIIAQFVRGGLSESA